MNARLRWFWVMTLAAGLLAQMPARAGTEVCERRQITAAANFARAWLLCEARAATRGVLEDAALTRCLDSASTRFRAAYDRSLRLANESNPCRLLESSATVAGRFAQSLEPIAEALLPDTLPSDRASRNFYAFLLGDNGVASLTSKEIGVPNQTALENDAYGQRLALDRLRSAYLTKSVARLRRGGVDYAGEDYLSVAKSVRTAANSMITAITGGPLVDTTPVVVELVGGAVHTCARFDDGQVKCWGANAEGQLGLGDTNDRGDQANEMGTNLPTVDLGAGRVAVQLAAGGEHTCARLDNGDVKCWGLNDGGQLGLGDTDNRGIAAGQMGDALGSVALGSARTALQVTAGSSHTCARLDNGAVKCWGVNLDGQLGIGRKNNRGDVPGTLGDQLPAVQLGSGLTVVSLASGDKHNCAILNNQSLKCWGINDSGQLGLGDLISPRGLKSTDMGNNLPVVNLGKDQTPRQLTLGLGHSCARVAAGRVKCWGYNASNQLGLNDQNTRGDGKDEMGDKLPFALLGQGRTSVSIASGGDHMCALLDSGKVLCWGNNDLGQLGLGDNRTHSVLPNRQVDPGGVHAPRLIAAGDAHNCVVLGNAAVKCWGHNANGQLGLGDENNRGDQTGEMGSNLPVVDLGAESLSAE